MDGTFQIANHRFILHLQLQDFENLLLSDVDEIVKSFNSNEIELVTLKALWQGLLFRGNKNSIPKAVPPKRIENNVERYRKVL